MILVTKCFVYVTAKGDKSNTKPCAGPLLSLEESLQCVATWRASVIKMSGQALAHTTHTHTHIYIVKGLKRRLGIQHLNRNLSLKQLVLLLVTKALEYKVCNVMCH